MRVYLSARFERQLEMERYSEQLRAEGVEVMSEWQTLNSPSSNRFNGLAKEQRTLFAMMDLQQLAGANAIVEFTDDPDATGGASVEFGIALALGKRAMLVGSPRNRYHELPDVEKFPAWPECFARLLDLRKTDAMTARQAAGELNVTSSDVHKYIDGKKLQAVKQGRRWIIARNELDRFKALRNRQAAEKASQC